MNILPVILSGGSGSRLWPQSRHLYPKQFLSLVNEQTMFQNTVTRLQGIESPVAAPVVIANNEHRFLVAEQFRQIDIKPASIILEPVGRNTAPAVTLAALKARENGEDPVLLILAADHVIKDTKSFHQAVDDAFPIAASGKLVTFGIVPTHAETGYGYIKSSKRQSSETNNSLLVEEFVEKPDLVTAEKYLASGDFFWNSGMFLFKASRYLEELREYRPDIYEACHNAIATKAPDLDFIRLDEEAFKICPSDSIDYAVMENTSDAVVIPLDAGWSDVGSWSSLWEVSDKDKHGNVAHGDVILHNTSDSYVRSEKKLVTTIGVDNLIIIESDDAILVANKNQVQDVKHILEQLKAANRPESISHRKLYRPWGACDSIDDGDRFQVKRITVKPGEKLSQHKHFNRAEHWIVVKGTALVINGSKELILTENQSTYIPIGVMHQLENPGRTELELIEVRSGCYLNEDDIHRIQQDSQTY